MYVPDNSLQGEKRKDNILVTIQCLLYMWLQFTFFFNPWKLFMEIIHGIPCSSLFLQEKLWKHIWTDIILKTTVCHTKGETIKYALPKMLLSQALLRANNFPSSGHWVAVNLIPRSSSELTYVHYTVFTWMQIIMQHKMFKWDFCVLLKKLQVRMTLSLHGVYIFVPKIANTKDLLLKPKKR